MIDRISGTQEILRQWEAFGWTVLGVLVTIVVVVLVIDYFEQKRGD